MPALLAPSVSGQTAAPERRGSLGELMGLMAAGWQGGRRFAPGTLEVARAMTGALSGGSGGGFLIKPEWLDEVFTKAMETRGPLARCRLEKTTQARELWIRAYSETSLADGSRSGGIRAWWGSGETANLATLASTPSIAQIQFNLERLMLYLIASRDLMADSTIFVNSLNRAIYRELRYQIEGAMLVGNGVAQPRGVVNSLACFTVPADGGQTAGTISTTNIDGMWAHLWGPSWESESTIWCANSDTIKALDEVATTAGWPQATYLPQGQLGNKHPLIKGRPLVVMMQLPAIGTPGDLVLCDWDQYTFVTHRMNDTDSGAEIAMGLGELGGDAVESMFSDQRLFETDQVAWRIKLRGDGKLMWPTQVKNSAGFALGPACIIAQR